VSGSSTADGPPNTSDQFHTLRSGGWLIRVRVESIEWVGEIDTSAPSLSVREVARLLRDFAHSGQQAGTLERNVASGEYPLDAFRDNAGEWRIPVSSLQRYLRNIAASVPADYWLNVMEWGSLVQPPPGPPPPPTGNRPPKRALQRAWDEQRARFKRKPNSDRR
jgi:hypothetical protein